MKWNSDYDTKHCVESFLNITVNEEAAFTIQLLNISHCHLLNFLPSIKKAKILFNIA